VKPVLCLLPSPLLGPACWRAAGALLAAGGWDISEVPPWRRPVRTVVGVTEELLAAIPQDRDTVLVAHSNAGLFVPALARSRPRVAGYVFTDAGLPPAGSRQVPVAPASFRDMVTGLADSGGLLSAWTAWWAAEELSGLFPDAATRAEVEAEQRRPSLSYFSETVPVPAGWPARPGAYLAFGTGYTREERTARELGWPTRVLDGGHLHMLVDPPGVAAAIASLAKESCA
jgi:hypothetical protein